jgi:PadR family transcriptional regulator PadR
MRFDDLLTGFIRFTFCITLERKGYLVSRMQREGRVARKLYKATRLGKQGLALAKVRVREFTGEAMKH